jgi:hypothetical protein
VAQQQIALHGRVQHPRTPKRARHKQGGRHRQAQRNLAGLKKQPQRNGQQHAQHGRNRHTPVRGVRHQAAAHHPHDKKQNDVLRHLVARGHDPQHAHAPNQRRQHQRCRIGPLPRKNRVPHRLEPKVQQVHPQPNQRAGRQHAQPSQQPRGLYLPPQRPAQDAGNDQALVERGERLLKQQGQRVRMDQSAAGSGGRGGGRSGFGSGVFTHEWGHSVGQRGGAMLHGRLLVAANTMVLIAARADFMGASGLFCLKKPTYRAAPLVQNGLWRHDAYIKIQTLREGDPGMATLIPSLGTCVSRMTSGERIRDTIHTKSTGTNSVCSVWHQH